MRTHVALLRGVNVGGRNRVPMGDFKAAVEGLGHHDVVTYLQSGNAAFAAGRPEEDDKAIAAPLEAAVAERTGVRAPTIVLRGAELDRVVADNPFPGVDDPRLLHAVLLADEPDAAGKASVVAAVARARKKGSREDACVVGRALYLWTPDGFARSVLHAELGRGGAHRTPMSAGTARNWATVTALAGLTGG